MTADPGRQTRIVDIKGRQVVVRELLDAQLGLLVREAHAMKRMGEDIDPARAQRSMDLIMRTIGSAIVQQEDREWLDDLIVDGELALKDLTTVLKAFKEDPEPVKPVVRRGRPAKRT